MSHEPKHFLEHRDNELFVLTVTAVQKTPRRTSRVRIRLGLFALFASSNPAPGSGTKIITEFGQAPNPSVTPGNISTSESHRTPAVQAHTGFPSSITAGDALPMTTTRAELLCMWESAAVAEADGERFDDALALRDRFVSGWRLRLFRFVRHNRAPFAGLTERSGPAKGAREAEGVAAENGGSARRVRGRRRQSRREATWPECAEPEFVKRSVRGDAHSVRTKRTSRSPAMKR